MIHIYSGDGKGKTTAAIGLTVRAASHNIPVLFTQFLKDASSGEIKILKNLDNVKVMHSPTFYGFVRNMTEEQKAEVKVSYASFIEEIFEMIKQCAYEQIMPKTSVSDNLSIIETVVNNSDNVQECENNLQNNTMLQEDKAVNEIKIVVVLDEILHAINYAFVDEKKLIAFMKEYKDSVEFVLTGRNPSKRLIDISDYYTMFKNVRHVYDEGITARKGIEF